MTSVGQAEMEGSALLGKLLDPHRVHGAPAGGQSWSRAWGAAGAGAARRILMHWAEPGQGQTPSPSSPCNS